MNVYLPSVLPIVLGYNRFATTTKLCLDTLLPQAVDLGLSVLAIDNGSSDTAASDLASYKDDLAHPLQDQLALSINSKNLGFGGGMNAAVQLGLSSSDLLTNGQTPEWLLLINSDTLFPAGALKAWLTAMAAASKHVGVMAPVTNNAGNAQKIVLSLNQSSVQSSIAPTESTRIQDEFTTWSRAASQWINQPTKLSWSTQRADFFCVAIRTNVWQELNGLDPIYGRGYYEDFDFSLRAALAGYQCALSEDCLIYHQGSATFKASSDQRQLMRHNHEIFKERFPNVLMPHVRQSNLTLLQDQLNWLSKNQSKLADSNPLLMRMYARWQAAHIDMPRSWFKRWLWRKKLIRMQRSFPQYLPKLTPHLS